MLPQKHLDYFQSLQACDIKTGDDTKPYCQPERGNEIGSASIVLFPHSTEVVSEIVRYCNQHTIAVVPQGGLTGLAGSSIPNQSGNEIVINLSKMDKLITATDHYATAQAGMVLSIFKEEVAAKGRYFPLSYGSEQSAQLGGAVATNAGGINFLQYGGARQLILAIEVVMADGSIERFGNTVMKDNSGYDLKDLIIGSEGTLAIVTEVTFRLFNPPAQMITACIGLQELEHLLSVIQHFSIMMGSSFTAFEIMDKRAFDLGRQSYESDHGTLSLFNQPYPYYLLVESSTSSPIMNLQEMFFATLEDAACPLDVNDVIVADTLDKAKALWGCRHRISDAVKHIPGMAFDITVEHIGLFVPVLREIIEAYDNNFEVMIFGHAADGNLHTHVRRFGSEEPLSSEQKKMIESLILELLLAFKDKSVGVSISAEHGIGRHKKEMLEEWHSPQKLAMMKQVKSVFDPKAILHPGVIFDLD